MTLREEEEEGMSIWVIEENRGGKWVIRFDLNNFWSFNTRKEAERFVFRDGGLSRKDFRVSRYIRARGETVRESV